MTDDLPIGEWVNLTDDRGPAVLVETGVDVERVNEIFSDEPSVSYSSGIGDGVPYDVLRDKKQVYILPRTDWRERHPYPPRPDR